MLPTLPHKNILFEKNFNLKLAQWKFGIQIKL